LVLLFRLWWRTPSDLAPRLDAAAWACALPLVLGPVAFPWYALPVAWFAALAENARLTLWCLALPLSYEVLDGFDTSGVWAPATWPLVVFAFVLLAPGGLTRRVVFMDRP
ncbi:MAG: hypothetical protein IT564_11855, partial [Rhodospirillales bacterium]|nr:hypothetical protein [Rhodospirillales bacterium]